MTILARMGVPGFFLWILLQGSLAWHFFSRWRVARSAGDRFLQGILAWVLCYWVAAMVNASFDVYLEGPQGSIWFWSVMGLGLAASNAGSCSHSATDEVPAINEQIAGM
jgi:O-antigen ligase